MRLKDLEAGMVVHCKTEEEAKQLLEWAYESGLLRSSYGYTDFDLPEECIKEQFEKFKPDLCYRPNGDKSVTYGDIDWFKAQGCGKITEFADLIIPEPETQKLTAEEAVEWLCEHYNDGQFIEAFGTDYSFGDIVKNMIPSEVVDGIEKWKAKHEQPKEPETEWVWQVFGVENSGKKFFQTEEDAIRRCEEIAKLNGKQCAWYERVCRLKETE